MRLIDLLEWRPNAPLHAEYEHAFNRRAEARFSWALAAVRRRHAQVGDDFVSLVQDLPLNALQRVMFAPELEYQSRLAHLSADGVDGLTRFLSRSLQAELVLADERITVTGGPPLWTALGDAQIHRSEENALGPPLRVDRAPEVDRQLPVDLDSPHNRGDVDRRFPDSTTLLATARETTVSRIREAWRLVELSSPEAHAFTRSFTLVITLIQVPSIKDDHGSFSSSWYPGRTVLVNPHSQRMGLYEHAAALVHEAIHGLIDASELGKQLLAEGRRPRHTVRSPWTGATLSLQSLLDAYFVWYGLLWFWRRAVEHNAVPPSTGHEQITRCQRGFHTAFEHVVKDELPTVHPYARDSIAQLREAVATVFVS